MVLCLFIYFFDCTVSSLLCRLFSTCGEQGLFSSCNVQTSYCSGFSHCGAQALSMQASAVASHGLSGEVPRGSRAQSQWLWLSCPEACGIFWDQESNLCLLHEQADTLPLNHHGSPCECFIVIILFLHK